MIPDVPPPPPRHRPLSVEKRAPSDSSSDINVDKVRAMIQKKRADSGQTPGSGTNVPKPEQETTEDVDPEKVRAILRLTRACAIKNAQSSETLKDVQSSTPGRGFMSGKFKTRGTPPSPGAPLDLSTEAKQKKERSS